VRLRALCEPGTHCEHRPQSPALRGNNSNNYGGGTVARNSGLQLRTNPEYYYLVLTASTDCRARLFEVSSSYVYVMLCYGTPSTARQLCRRQLWVVASCEPGTHCEHRPQSPALRGTCVHIYKKTSGPRNACCLLLT
jgi:hypothetical protein